MRRIAAGGIIAAFIAGLLGVMPALSHECGYDPDNPEECRETPIVPNWRDNYVPLFDLPDREDEDQRRDAQRWREECQRDGEYRQTCVWSYGGFSVVPNRDGSDPSPNEWHVGVAASHCFLFEAAHQCEDHDASYGEGVHDAHGGAGWASICLTPNPESKRCEEGMKGTEVGVVIVDHNPCGLVIPVVACTDEYHVIRPFDEEYTAKQMENTEASLQLMVENPRRYVCGYGPGSDFPWCAAIPGEGWMPSSGL